MSSNLTNATHSGPDDAENATRQAAPRRRSAIETLSNDGTLQFVAVVLEMGLLILIIMKFQLQNQRFLDLLVLAWAGFTVQHFLPLRFRMPFFAAISMGGIGVVLGVTSGAWLVGIGLVLIGLAHLPVPYVARVALLIAAGIGLALLRLNPMLFPQVAVLWPIIGSMFMFRMIIYLYDMKHNAAPVSPARSLSYFFMLPNVFFPLFPVVDYKTFCRSHWKSVV